MMDSLFEKWDNDGCGYLDMEDVETVMQKYKEGQENEAIVRGKTDKDQWKIFILHTADIFFFWLYKDEIIKVSSELPVKFCMFVFHS